MEDRNEDNCDKMSLAIALLIAACIIGLFCAISIAIAQNIDVDSDNEFGEHFSIKPSRNYLTEHPFL